MSMFKWWNESLTKLNVYYYINKAENAKNLKL